MYFGGMGGGDPFGRASTFGGASSFGGRNRQVDNTKFYEALEIDKNTSEADIKKSYRKLALKHHPDKGGDPAKFKEIGRAYEVLGDPEKRRQYDEYGEEGLDGGGGADASDIFDLFFGGGGGGGQRARKQRTPDIDHKLNVTLEQLYTGTSRRLQVNKDVLCDVCAGHGGPKAAYVTCQECRGTGQKTTIRHMGHIIQQYKGVCGACQGRGQWLPDDKQCKSCRGKGTTKEKKMLEVFVEAGRGDGHRVVFSGDADQVLGHDPGDVVVTLRQSKHPIYTRANCHLHYTRQVTLCEALTGYKFTLKHLDGRKLLISGPPNEIITPGCKRALKDEGMPTAGNPFFKGYLIITFDVIFPLPQQINPKDAEKLRNILPRPTHRDIPETGEETDPQCAVVVSDSELKQREAQSKSAEPEDEDDDRHDPQGGRGGGVQCQQQ